MKKFVYVAAALALACSGEEVEKTESSLIHPFDITLGPLTLNNQEEGLFEFDDGGAFDWLGVSLDQSELVLTSCTLSEVVVESFPIRKHTSEVIQVRVVNSSENSVESSVTITVIGAPGGPTL